MLSSGNCWRPRVIRYIDERPILRRTATHTRQYTVSPSSPCSRNTFDSIRVALADAFGQRKRVIRHNMTTKIRQSCEQSAGTKLWHWTRGEYRGVAAHLHIYGNWTFAPLVQLKPKYPGAKRPGDGRTDERAKRPQIIFMTHNCR